MKEEEGRKKREEEGLKEEKKEARDKGIKVMDDGK